MRHTSGKAKQSTRWQYMNINQEKGSHSWFWTSWDCCGESLGQEVPLELAFQEQWIQRSLWCWALSRGWPCFGSVRSYIGGSQPSLHIRIIWHSDFTWSGLGLRHWYFWLKLPRAHPMLITCSVSEPLAPGFQEPNWSSSACTPSWCSGHQAGHRGCRNKWDV